MKTLVRITIGLIMVIVVSANTICAKEGTLKDVSDIIVNSFIEELGSDLNISSSTPLYDGSDKINGYWYHLGDDEGYIIIFNWSGDLKITEYSLEGDLSLDPTKKTYYDGIVSYYQQSESNKMKMRNNIGTVEKNVNDLYKAPDLDMSKVNKTIETIKNGNRTATRSTLNATLDHPIVHICQNRVTGTGYSGSTLCTQTSSAMLINYHDKYSGKDDLATNSEEDLVKSILNYMIPDNSNGSTSLVRFKSGLTNYISSRGYSSNINYQISDEYGNSISNNYPNTIYQDILNERPGIVIVGKNAETVEGNGIVSSATTLHAMTVYGIKANSDGFYLQVDDPYEEKSTSAKKTVIWDTYPYPGEPSAIYAVGRVIIY